MRESCKVSVRGGGGDEKGKGEGEGDGREREGEGEGEGAIISGRRGVLPRLLDVTLLGGR